MGFKPEMLGDTAKGTPLLTTPPTVTTTLPVVAPPGTGTLIALSIQEVGVAGVPLKVTVLVPCVGPKPPPLIATDVPPVPDVGFKLMMLGVTVKRTPLLAMPPTVTTTGPVLAPPLEIVGVGTVATMLVAVQLVTAAPNALKVIVLVPCVVPKLKPVMVTDVPTGPDVGLRLEMLGGVVTVKATPLLARPPTVTTTFPVVAPVGTGTPMLVALQLVGVAVVPLNVTVLVPCVAPKFVPATATEVPTGPAVGFRLVILGVVPPVPPAARKATICMIHGWTVSRTAVAL